MPSRRSSVWVAGLAGLLLAGCGLPKPVSLDVEDGGLEVEDVGRVWGKGLHYRSGLLEPGEAAAAFGEKMDGFQAAPAPVPEVKPAPAPAPAPEAKPAEERP